MRRQYLVGPFICTLACWTYGNGTLPILPLYAMERGASETASGLFLAFAFLCLALGTVATGLLPKDFGHRKWLVAASGLLIVGLALLTSLTTTLMSFAAATGLSWFLAGVVFSQAASLTGLAADSADRGVAFGILGMSNGLGAIIGGIGVGYVVDRLGFRGVFESMATFSVLIVIEVSFPSNPLGLRPPARKAADKVEERRLALCWSSCSLPSSSWRSPTQREPSDGPL